MGRFLELRERAATALLNKAAREEEKANTLGARGALFALPAIDHGGNVPGLVALARRVAPPEMRRKMPTVREVIFGTKGKTSKPVTV